MILLLAAALLFTPSPVQSGTASSPAADPPGVMLAQNDAPAPPVTSARPAPSAPRFTVGMNLAGLSNFSTELPFIDYLKLGGDPTKGQLSIPVAPGPIDLVLLYDGSTAVSVYDAKASTANAIGYNAMSPKRYARGRVTFHSDTGGSVNLVISHSDPADPIRNIHLVRARDEAAFKAGATLNPDFLSFIKAFSPVRTMDWSCTNGSPIAHWAERPKMTDLLWTCAPLEVQVALANEAGADLWLNIPHLADDEYIRQAVTLVRDTLAPGLKLHLEYSNELWNLQFDQTKYAQAQADKLWGKGASVPWGNEMWAGYRGAQMAAIARDVFGAEADRRLAVVYSPFPHWKSPELIDIFDKGVARAGKGAVSALFRDYATTTYFGGEFGIPGGPVETQRQVLALVLGGAAGLDKAFRQLEHGDVLYYTSNGQHVPVNGSLDWLASTYALDAARAKARGLDLVAYEGGLHISYFGTDHPAEFTDFVKRMEADPRMKALYTRMATDFRDAGGRALTHFNDVGISGIFGAWPVIDRLGETSPEYEALRAVSGR